MHIYCQWQICSLRSAVSGDISLMPMFLGVRWWDGVKWECSRRKCELSLSIAIFSMKFPTGFKYRNLSKFPGDSTVLVFLTLTASYFTLAFCQHYFNKRIWWYDHMYRFSIKSCYSLYDWLIDWYTDKLMDYYLSCQQTVTHPSSNRTRCWLTTLIEASALTTWPLH